MFVPCHVCACQRQHFHDSTMTCYNAQHTHEAGACSHRAIMRVGQLLVFPEVGNSHIMHHSPFWDKFLTIDPERKVVALRDRGPVPPPPPFSCAHARTASLYDASESNACRAGMLTHLAFHHAVSHHYRVGPVVGKWDFGGRCDSSGRSLN